jgi:NAD(P)-dependent dehydrogenase (short-subunit alcohol dehydrogenase family)
MKPQVALVTGGASGIGEALCRALASESVQVIVADINGTAAEKLAREIGGSAIAVDLPDVLSTEDMIRTCLARYSRIDVFINCAGILARGAAETFAPEDWDRSLNVNLRGAVLASLAVYRQMLVQGSGHIVNVASLSGLNATPFCLPYVTTKYGLVGFCLALRSEARRFGIRVSVVCPGNVATPMIAAHSSTLSRATPPATPEAAARAILRGIRSNSATIVFPAYARAIWLLERWSPRLSGWFRNYIASK